MALITSLVAGPAMNRLLAQRVDAARTRDVVTVEAGPALAVTSSGQAS